MHPARFPVGGGKANIFGTDNDLTASIDEDILTVICRATGKTNYALMEQLEKGSEVIKTCVKATIIIGGLS